MGLVRVNRCAPWPHSGERWLHGFVRCPALGPTTGFTRHPRNTHSQRTSTIPCSLFDKEKTRWILGIHSLDGDGLVRRWSHRVTIPPRRKRKRSSNDAVPGRSDPKLTTLSASVTFYPQKQRFSKRWIVFFSSPGLGTLRLRLPASASLRGRQVPPGEAKSGTDVETRPLHLEELRRPPFRSRHGLSTPLALLSYFVESFIAPALLGVTGKRR